MYRIDERLVSRIVRESQQDPGKMIKHREREARDLRAKEAIKAAA